MRWVGHVAYMEEKRSILGVKEKRILGRTRRSWEDNIKMNLNVYGWFGLDLSGSVQGQMAGSCDHGNELSDGIKSKEFLEY
jgi:hypothetical protein